jgi:hypothetical protein
MAKVVHLRVPAVDMDEKGHVFAALMCIKCSIIVLKDTIFIC